MEKGHRKVCLVSGAILGGILALGPLWGLLGTVFGMITAFDQIAQQGSADAEAVGGSIRIALVTTWVGLAAAPIGIALLVLCILGLSRLQGTGDQAAPTPE